jgi:hypothetical protein
VAQRINPDYQAVQFTTSKGRRLELWDTLLSWQDDHNPALVEHRVFKRKGAIHQDVGGDPRRHVLRCVFIGANVGDRYRALIAALEEDPTGTLVHPRFGNTPAVYQGAQAQEDPATAVDEITFTLRFSETGLRSAPKEAAGGIAAGALQAATTFTAGAPASFTVLGRALTKIITTLVTQISSAVASVQRDVQLIEMAQTLNDLRTTTSSIQAQATVQGRYDLYAQAALIYAQALNAYAAARDERPPVGPLKPTPATMSLLRWCTTLYGGRLARQLRDELLILNRIPNPAALPAGTVLLGPDPEVVRAR